jgi:hypothetical protein
MLNLQGLQPLSVFPMVVAFLQMFYMPFPVMNVSAEICIGGAFYLALVASTPMNLIPDFIPAIPLLHVPHPFPRYVQHNANSEHGPNWAM